MNKLIIIGAGGHGRVCAEIAGLCGYCDIAFLDDGESKELNIIGKSAEWNKYLSECEIFVAIGNNAVRKRFLEEIITAGGKVATLIHPGSVVSKNAVIEKGAVIMTGAVVNTDSVIGRGSIINTCSSVDHDCRIGAYSHISVGAHLAGSVTVGACTMIGAGATVINNIDICEDCIIGAGGVVIKNIVDCGTYVGVPVRKLG